MRPIAFLTVFLLSLVFAPPAVAADWIWPVRGEVITPYRNGADPYAAGQHRGIDIAAPVAAPVVAATAYRDPLSLLPPLPAPSPAPDSPAAPAPAPAHAPSPVPPAAAPSPAPAGAAPAAAPAPTPAPAHPVSAPTAGFETGDHFAHG